MSRKADLTGRIFGELEILEDTGKRDKYRGVIWKARCNACGTVVEKSARNFLSGGMKSCGCKNTLDLTKRQFEGIQILSKVTKRDKTRSVYWRVYCKVCKETSEIATANLVRRKQMKSCGCLRGSKYKPGEAGKKNLLKSYKDGARRRNLEFSLTQEQFYTLTAQPCHYCGAEHSITTYKTGLATERAREYSAFQSNGIDRVDNSKGYTLENSVPCCKMCNTAKHHHTLEEFTNWITRAHAHLNKSN